MRITTLAAAVLLAGTACSSKDSKKTPPPTKTTSTPSTPTKPATPPKAPMRPSEGTLATMAARAAAPTEPAKLVEIALGHNLFLDKRLSVDDSRSCYSCHQNEQGTGGKEAIAIGAGDKQLTRHSPVLWNVGLQPGGFYWDGRAATLEAQIIGAWSGGNLGVGKEPGALDAKAATLAKLPEYKKAFEAAYPGQPVTADLVATAIAAYERTLVCDDTAYDKFAAGDKTAMNDAQQRGYDVFAGKGGCMTCHTPPQFSIAMMTEGGAYFNAGIGTDKPEPDLGRGEITKKPEDASAFKPPSLRNVAKSAPYFHNGSSATLAEAVKIMATGGIANPNKSTLLTDRGLTAEELADLVEFLGALDCPGSIDTNVISFDGKSAGSISLATGLPVAK